MTCSLCDAECPGDPPALGPLADKVQWEPGCSNTVEGGFCQGFCKSGSVIALNGAPRATCSQAGTWVVKGGCTTLGEWLRQYIN